MTREQFREHLKRYPLCADCERDGNVTAANSVRERDGELRSVCFEHAAELAHR